MNFKICEIWSEQSEKSGDYDRKMKKKIGLLIFPNEIINSWLLAHINLFFIDKMKSLYNWSWLGPTNPAS